MSIKFSVLLNNYNYGRYLEEAIGSVLAQTHKNFELLIVDDGSTDNSREIIARQTDSRIVPVLKENGGQGSAFKAGFDHATGEYVAFLDADDLWDANKLQRCAEVLNQQKDIVLLNHNYREIEKVTSPFPPELLPGDYDMRDTLRNHSILLQLVPTSFFLGRLTECKQLDYDAKQWRIAADTPVLIGLALRGKIYNLDEKLGSYRMHGSNLWNGRFIYEGSNPASSHHNTDLDPICAHYERFYRYCNEEQLKLGHTEQFDFSMSDLAISRHIMNTSRLSPRGIYWRMIRMLRGNRDSVRV